MSARIAKTAQGETRVNSHASASTLSVKPVSGALGAEVGGVDVSKPLSEQQQATLRAAFLQHQVLFFRDQSMTPEQHLTFTRVFGTPDTYPFMVGLPETPEVIDIVKTESDSVNFGGSWHSDTAYLPQPALGTVLHAIEVPEHGGDTLFANAAAAYDALTEGMKELLDGVIGVYDSDHGYGGSRRQALGKLELMNDRYDESSESFLSEHPVIRTHPETGRKAIYVSKGHTSHFKNMSYEESRPIINYLAEHIVRPEFTCRFRWTPGAIAVWDNRSTQHYAINDYAGKRRHMRRVTMAGDTPV